MLDVDLASTGLDWFTATTQSDQVGQAWFEIFRKHEKSPDNEGFQRQDWRNRWYDGVRFGGLTWGYRPQAGYIMIASGIVAWEYWARVLPSASRVTRLDLQVTCRLKKPVLGVAKASYKKAQNIKLRKYALIQNSRDGQTLYVGSRHSDQYGRLYDKGVQSNEAEPGVLWRYEAEIKKPRADVLTRELYARFCDGENISRDVQAYVYNWFDKRGVSPIFSPVRGALLGEVGKRITTADKKLSWIRAQVRPSVQRLISSGLHKEVANALGFDARQVGMFADALGPDDFDGDQGE